MNSIFSHQVLNNAQRTHNRTERSLFLPRRFSLFLTLDYAYLLQLNFSKFLFITLLFPCCGLSRACIHFNPFEPLSLCSSYCPSPFLFVPPIPNISLRPSSLFAFSLRMLVLTVPPSSPFYTFSPLISNISLCLCLLSPSLRKYIVSLQTVLVYLQLPF